MYAVQSPLRMYPDLKIILASALQVVQPTNMGLRGTQWRSSSRRSWLIAALSVVFCARAAEGRARWTTTAAVHRKNRWTMPWRKARIRGGGGCGSVGGCPASGNEGGHSSSGSNDHDPVDPPPNARIPPSNPRMPPTSLSEQQQWGDPSRNGRGSDTPLVASTAPLLPKELPAGPVNPSSRSVPVLRLTSEGVAVETTLSRQQLATELNCPLRDLRVADPTFPGQFPSVLARCGSIIFSVAEVKAVIRAHELLLFPTTPDVLSIVPAVQEKIQLLGTKGVVPFEQTAMECCLKHVCKTLLDSARNVEPRLRAVLGSFKTSKNSRIKSLHRLLPLKNELDELQETLVMVCKSMNDVLMNDEDMALMYLTENDKAATARDPEEHQEVEMLFENYLLQVELLASEIREYQNEVRNTEEIVEIELDVLRNNILRFELLLSISGFMVTLGALVTGVFGMNLLSGWEEKPLAFWEVTGGIYGCILLSIAGTVALCRRLSLL